jgi:hypothetical protein
MWWNQPRLREYPPLLPDNILEVTAAAYAVVEVGGLSGFGPERGRNFERLFYRVCDARGVCLTERAGSRSLAGQRSASGFAHEVDGATKTLDCITHWELKHLTSELPKNELLAFNGKGLDFLCGTLPLYAGVPLRRFLLSGANVGEESRAYCVQWGITLVEPNRFPLPLLYEAIARGAGRGLSDYDRSAVRSLGSWACRSLQQVIRELHDWTAGSQRTWCGPEAASHVCAALALQEQVGFDVTDCLAESHPEWVDETAVALWDEVGGW